MQIKDPCDANPVTSLSLSLSLSLSASASAKSGLCPTAAELGTGNSDCVDDVAEPAMGSQARVRESACVQVAVSAGKDVKRQREMTGSSSMIYAYIDIYIYI